MEPKQITALTIFKNLPRTNCKDCGFPTCLAFASKVFVSERPIQDCPHVSHELVEQLSGPGQKNERSDEETRADLLAELKEQMHSIDLREAAGRVLGWMVDDRLALRCLGKVFEVDARGELHSECHVNMWIHAPLLDHLLHSAGAQPTGEWLAFDQLKDSLNWTRFFKHRCEQGLRALADRDPDLFLDALSLFGKSLPTHAAEAIITSADEVVLLYPFPLLPVAISYWRKEEGFESRLALRFDRSCEANLSCGLLYTLCQGLLEMLRRIISRHGC